MESKQKRIKHLTAHAEGLETEGRKLRNEAETLKMLARAEEKKTVEGKFPQRDLVDVDELFAENDLDNYYTVVKQDEFWFWLQEK